MTTRIIGRYWVQNGSKEYFYRRGYLTGGPITLGRIRKFNGSWRVYDPETGLYEKTEYRAVETAKAVVAQKHARKK